jgi:DNA-binding FrmR family transcriptional regulator
VSKPNPVSTVVLIDVVNSVEGLVNLAYLIEQNRHNPDDVLRYIRMVDVTLKRMTSLIVQTHMSETLETTSQ